MHCYTLLSKQTISYLAHEDHEDETGEPEEDREEQLDNSLPLVHKVAVPKNEDNNNDPCIVDH